MEQASSDKPSLPRAGVGREEFTDRFKQAIGRLVVGNGMEECVSIGSLINDKAAYDIIFVIVADNVTPEYKALHMRCIWRAP